MLWTRSEFLEIHFYIQNILLNDTLGFTIASFKDQFLAFQRGLNFHKDLSVTQIV
jgi:hypothetical protein